ncbi:MAG TPA: hypothetical protein VLD19_09755, partial [Chitinophagaceae bacterium]|nr:hypothetical protein [Chitinophagaceae bacterium]
MKRILNVFLITALLVSAAGCDKGLEGLNVNKVSPTTLDPALMLNQAMINFSFPFKTLVFDIGAVQQIVTPN